MILKSLIRTFFLDLALKVASDKLERNLIFLPRMNTYPRTEAGLLLCVRRGELYTLRGKRIEVGDVKSALFFRVWIWNEIDKNCEYPERFIEEKELKSK